MKKQQIKSEKTLSYIKIVKCIYSSVTEEHFAGCKIMIKLFKKKFYELGIASEYKELVNLNNLKYTEFDNRSKLSTIGVITKLPNFLNKKSLY